MAYLWAQQIHYLTLPPPNQGILLFTWRETGFVAIWTPPRPPEMEICHGGQMEEWEKVELTRVILQKLKDFLPPLSVTVFNTVYVLTF